MSPHAQTNAASSHASEEAAYAAEHARTLAGIVQAQADALGITEADVQRLHQDLASGAVSYRDVIGLT